MASARRTGTNESVSTLQASGGDYTVATTWEAATDNDNVTGTVSPVLACAAEVFNQNVTLNGSTNNATYFRIVRPQSGAFHTGIRDTGVRFYSTSSPALGVINIGENYSQVQDVAASLTLNSTAVRGTLVSAATLDAANPGGFIGCIATQSNNAGSGVSYGCHTNSAFMGQIMFVDCLGDACESSNFRMESNTSSNPVVYNCTSAGSGTGYFAGSNGTKVIRNSLGYNNTTDFSANWDTAEYNASADTSAPGTNSRTSQTFTFVNAAGFDYHLASGDAGAKDFGTDLSADAKYAFDDDIDRVTRSGSWDIGAHEFIAAGGLNVNWLGHYPSQILTRPEVVGY